MELMKNICSHHIIRERMGPWVSQLIVHWECQTLIKVVGVHTIGAVIDVKGSYNYLSRNGLILLEKNWIQNELLTVVQRHEIRKTHRFVCSGLREQWRREASTVLSVGLYLVGAPETVWVDRTCQILQKNSWNYYVTWFIDTDHSFPTLHLSTDLELKWW